MLDLETMSTESNACVCSIGAVKFAVGEGFIDEFYVTVDAKDCKRLGLHFSQDTLRWWSQQNPEALKMLLQDNLPLHDALVNFTAWFGPKSLKTWGHGSAFDCVILRNAYKAAGLKEPWHYRHEMCYRTVCALIKLPEDTRFGTYHNALDDAKHQAHHLLKILES